MPAGSIMIELLALATSTSNNLRLNLKLESSSTFSERNQAISANRNPVPWASSRTKSENSESDMPQSLASRGTVRGTVGTTVLQQVSLYYKHPPTTKQSAWR